MSVCACVCVCVCVCAPHTCIYTYAVQIWVWSSDITIGYQRRLLPATSLVSRHSLHQLCLLVSRDSLYSTDPLRPPPGPAGTFPPCCPLHSSPLRYISPTHLFARRSSRQLCLDRLEAFSHSHTQHTERQRSSSKLAETKGLFIVPTFVTKNRKPPPKSDWCV